MITSFTRRRALAAGAALAYGMAAWPSLDRACEETEVKKGGRLTGVLRFTGKTPAEDQVSISKDSHVCRAGHISPNPVTLSSDRALKDGVVALRKVSAGKPMTAALTRPKIVQEASRFEPFVQLAAKGSDLTIVNLDPLLHNIHGYEQISRAWRTLFNIAQPAAGQTDRATLKMRRGSVVETDCDAITGCRLGSTPPIIPIWRPPDRTVFSTSPKCRQIITSW